MTPWAREVGTLAWASTMGLVPVFAPDTPTALFLSHPLKAHVLSLPPGLCPCPWPWGSIPVWVFSLVASTSANLLWNAVCSFRWARGGEDLFPPYAIMLPDCDLCPFSTQESFCQGFPLCLVTSLVLVQLILFLWGISQSLKNVANNFPEFSIPVQNCWYFYFPLVSWVGKIPWRRAWQSTPVFLPGESPQTEETNRL